MRRRLWAVETGRGLTFDVRGGLRLAARRPLDGGVRQRHADHLPAFGFLRSGGRAGQELVSVMWMLASTV
jgi:hypothetical protein